MDFTEKKLSSQTYFEGRIFRLHVDKVLLPNGKESTREVADHPGGVAILALDDRDNVLTVNQYRYVFGRVTQELPAGKMEPGEEPVLTALRELKEETGAVPDSILPLGAILPSPGCFGEVLHMFLAQGLHMEGQQPDEDEFLSVERVPFDEMVHRVMAGEIQDAKTVAAVLKAKVLLNR